MRTGDALRAELVKLNAGNSWRKDWPGAPWEASIGGRAWAIATDGHVLVGVRRDLVPGECSSMPKVVGTVAHWIAERPTCAVPVEVTELRKFAGIAVEVCKTCDNERRVDCDECDGSGENDECECHCGHIHSSPCDRCNGRGDKPCPDCRPFMAEPVRSRFLTLVVNRSVLARALDAVDPCDGTTIVASVERIGGYGLKPTDPTCYVLADKADNPDWVMLVMAMRQDLSEATGASFMADVLEAVK